MEEPGDAGHHAVDAGPSTFWYRDCDDDGYAAGTAGRVLAAVKPGELVDCLGWTDRRPIDYTDTDCDDTSAVRHPGAAPGLPITANGQPLPPKDDLAYDLNCDGKLDAVFPLTTGTFRTGRLVLVDFCAPDMTCTGATAPCITSWSFSGVPSCGVCYGQASDFACVSASCVYYSCQ